MTTSPFKIADWSRIKPSAGSGWIKAERIRTLTTSTAYHNLVLFTDSRNNEFVLALDSVGMSGTSRVPEVQDAVQRRQQWYNVWFRHGHDDFGDQVPEYYLLASYGSKSEADDMCKDCEYRRVGYHVDYYENNVLVEREFIPITEALGKHKV